MKPQFQSEFFSRLALATLLPWCSSCSAQHSNVPVADATHAATIAESKAAIARISLPKLELCVPIENRDSGPFSQIGQPAPGCAASVDFFPAGIEPIRQGELTGIRLKLTVNDQDRLSKFASANMNKTVMLTRSGVVLHIGAISGTTIGDISIVFDGKKQEKEFLRLLLH